VIGLSRCCSRESSPTFSNCVLCLLCMDEDLVAVVVSLSIAIFALFSAIANLRLESESSLASDLEESGCSLGGGVRSVVASAGGL